MKMRNHVDLEKGAYTRVGIILPIRQSTENHCVLLGRDDRYEQEPDKSQRKHVYILK